MIISVSAPWLVLISLFLFVFFAAATISKDWDAGATIMNAVAVTTGSFSSDVDLELNGYEGAHVTVEPDFPGSPTDDLEVYIQASLDGTNYDDTALSSFIIDKDTDPNQVSFIVRDVAHFRLFVKRSGSTDTITVTAKYQPWRWQSVETG